MEHIHITIQTILSFFGAVAIIGGGIKIIAEATSPFKAMKKRIDEQDEKLDNDNRRLKEIDENYKELKATLNANSKLLIQIADHLITGNDVDKLKQKRDDLISHVMNK